MKFSEKNGLNTMDTLCDPCKWRVPWKTLKDLTKHLQGLRFLPI